MDRKNRAPDNVFTERLWRTVKYEEVYIHDHDSPRSAREGLERYFGFYNHGRPHESSGYQTPHAVYTGTVSLSPITTPASRIAVTLRSQQRGQSSFDTPS